MMKVGIVGLPNVGKSTFFNLLTKANAKVDLYPFTTIDKNVGMVIVPDERLRIIGDIIKPQKLTPATIEFIDIAGLVKGAHEGEGLGNKFLGNIRETDMILHIIRNFENGSVPHVYNNVDPIRDLEIVESELALADLDIIKRQVEPFKKKALSADEKLRLAVLELLETNLSKGIFSTKLEHNDYQIIKDLHLFCIEPVIYTFNCSDRLKAELPFINKLEGMDFYLISASLEESFDGFEENEKIEMRQSLGLAQLGVMGIVEACFKKLDLIRFYTIKGDESRAWSIPRGTHVVDAAQKIHTDMAAGFIKAEVIQFSDLEKIGNYHKAKETGHIRIEGKNYIVQDGDIILIKFAVH